MSVNPPIAQLQRVDLTTDRGKKFLIDILNQIYVELGSGEPLVSNTEALSSTISSRLNARINDISDKQDVIRAELNTVRSLLRGTVSELQEQQCEVQGIKVKVASQLYSIADKIEELEGLL